MKTLLALLLLVPVLCFGNSVSFSSTSDNDEKKYWNAQIIFSGNTFKNEITNEYLTFFEDGSFTGKVSKKTNNGWFLETMKGAYETYFYDNSDSEFGLANVNRIYIYSGNVKCEYNVYRKKPNFFWFSIHEKNFNNVCYDTLMIKLD